MSQPVTLKPGKKIELSDFDPAHNGDEDKEKAAAEFAKNIAVVDELSYRLYADGRFSLLIILQGMDTAGKDGVIRKVLSGVDPVNCRVTAFKVPNLKELSHDFLWRIHKATPARGDVGIFNRSQYEDVLSPRVHGTISEKVALRRCQRINEFEQQLVDEGTTIVKFFLHISKEEQRQRLEARLQNPQKRWKFRVGDLDDRKLWKEFERAYNDLLTCCNTEHAPWHIVPADRKWYRDLVVSRVLRETLEGMKLEFPKEEEGLDKIVVE